MSDPDKNPWAGMAMGLPNHVPDAPCDDTCTEYPALVANTGGFFDYRTIKLNADTEPGWCAPSSALYDLVTLPEITVRRGPITYPATPPVAPPRVPWRTRMRYRVRRLRSRITAARGAFRAPDEWWDR